MIAALKPYPAYKDSGVSWLGEVPAHWEVRRLKQICRLAYGDALTTEMRQEGTVPVFGSNGRVGFHNSANTKAPCIVVGRKGSFGKVNYSRDSVYAIDTTFFIDSCFSDTHIRWLFFLLGWLRLDEVTKDSAVPGLDREDAYQRLAPIPPLPEQTAIVRFLDHADRRIRRYIRAKQKLIALLEEQKQAIIHQAVTGQIDVRTGQPYPAYKPSGVEWLGKVPAHWEVSRVKSLSLVKRGASPRPIGDARYFDNGGEYAWVRIADVTASNHYLEKTTQRLSRFGQSLSVPLQPGALFLSIAGSVGKPIITKIKCCIHDGFVYFPQFRGNVEFLYRVFSCGAPFARLGKLGTQLNLNTDTVGGIYLGWPPESEQSAIVGFLDNETGSIGSAIASTRREIDLLHEYRTRLIADVVTGKLDVREAAAALPEVDPLAAEDTLDTDTHPNLDELNATLAEVDA